MVAQQALSMLQESKVISSKGKLISELNPHKTLQSSDKTSLPLPADEGPLPLAAEGSMNKDGNFHSLKYSEHLIFYINKQHSG